MTPTARPGWTCAEAAGVTIASGLIGHKTMNPDMILAVAM